MNPDTWDQIRLCKKWGSADPDVRIIRLYAPLDDIHRALTLLAKSAAQQLSVAMYGWDDTELDGLVRSAWQNEHVAVKVALDSTQAAGSGETPLLKQWPQQAYGSELVIGQSSKHKISHMKLIAADDAHVGGSTNLSNDGETRQNNEAVFWWDAKATGEVHARIANVFSEMMSQPNALTHKQWLGA